MFRTLGSYPLRLFDLVLCLLSGLALDPGHGLVSDGAVVGNGSGRRLGKGFAVAAGNFPFLLIRHG